jgi:hypothetical protein
VLEEKRRVQRRVRDLPARVVVYLLLAGRPFGELGCPRVWQRTAAGLGGLPVAAPAPSAMTQARRRLGPGPLRELFFLLRGPYPHAARWKGLLVCAVDGTILTVADSPANLAVYSKQLKSTILGGRVLRARTPDGAEQEVWALLAGTIGPTVLVSLMPARRLRTSPRAVKRATSKYNAHGKTDRATRKATIDIAILAAPLTGDSDP